VSDKSIPAKVRQAVYERDGHRCAYCDFKFEPPRLEGEFLVGPVPTVDHVVPRSRGGKSDAANLVTACTSCNASKRNKTAAEFAAWREERR
jgi:5-methylcytosine-specific restriction endonuclease McrA